MALVVDIPGREPLELEILLLDVNGTVSDRGALLAGVAERLEALRGQLEPRLLSADTFHTLDSIAEQLSVRAQIAETAEDKLAVLRAIGARRCAVIGNGANDAGVLTEAGLGIAVIGPEGASWEALSVSDVVCLSVVDALELLREPRALAATMRR